MKMKRIMKSTRGESYRRGAKKQLQAHNDNPNIRAGLWYHQQTDLRHLLIDVRKSGIIFNIFTHHTPAVIPALIVIR